MRTLKITLISVGISAALLASTNTFAEPFPSPGAIPAASNTVAAYQDAATGKKCAISNETCATFSAITGSRVLILHVSCLFSLASGSAIEIAGIGTKDQTGAASNLFAVEKTADVTGGSVFVIDRQTYFFVEKGKAPEIELVSTKKPAENLQCTISGMHA